MTENNYNRPVIFMYKHKNTSGYEYYAPADSGSMMLLDHLTDTCIICPQDIDKLQVLCDVHRWILEIKE